MRVEKVYRDRQLDVRTLHGSVDATIVGWEIREYHDGDGGVEQCVAIRLSGMSEILVLNPVQATAVADIAGNDIEKWTGTAITLARVTDPFGIPTIRIHPAGRGTMLGKLSV